MTLEPLSSSTRDVTRWVEVLAPARQLAEVIAQTEFVPKAMRGKPDVVTAAIMYGDELALGPMQALQGIDVIEGRPRPSAELMRALILRAGHSLGIHEMTGTRCRVSGLRIGRPESERVTVEWTIDMAKAAGLLGKSNWRAYPRAMLLARAMSDLARVIFPDVIKGLSYVAEDDTHVDALDTWQPDATTDAQIAPSKQARVIQRKTPTRPPVAPELPPTRGARTVTDTDLPGDQPGDQPEQPVGDEPPAEGAEAMADGKQLTALHTLLGKIMGTDSPPDERRQVLADMVGRRLDSAKQLTREEAFRLRTRLIQVETGHALLTQDENERWHWAPSTREPDDEDPWRVPPDPLLNVNTETGELFDAPEQPGSSGRDQG